MLVFPLHEVGPMPRHRGKGVLVAFEGIDGAGKTTQANLLVSALLQADEPVTASKEPTTGDWGLRIRRSAAAGRLRPMEELKYFLRDREQHTQNLIRPALSKGNTVILDRYYYSTIAYQGARGFSVNDLKEMMEERFLVPDAVFLLDIDPAISLQRIAKRGDVPNEFERLQNLEKTRRVFLSLKDKRIILINAAMPIDCVHKEVLQKFIDGPLKHRRCAKSNGCEDHKRHPMASTCPWVRSAAKLRETLSSDCIGAEG